MGCAPGVVCLSRCLSSSPGSQRLVTGADDLLPTWSEQLALPRLLRYKVNIFPFAVSKYLQVVLLNYANTLFLFKLWLTVSGSVSEFGLQELPLGCSEADLLFPSSLWHSWVGFSSKEERPLLQLFVYLYRHEPTEISFCCIIIQHYYLFRCPVSLALTIECSDGFLDPFDITTNFLSLLNLWPNCCRLIWKTTARSLISLYWRVGFRSPGLRATCAPCCSSVVALSPGWTEPAEWVCPVTQTLWAVFSHFCTCGSMWFLKHHEFILASSQILAQYHRTHARLLAFLVGSHFLQHVSLFQH